MGARGWGIGMVVGLLAGVTVSCVGLLGGPSALMWVAPPLYLAGFACAVRMIDHLGSGADGPGRFTLLGWLRD